MKTQSSCKKKAIICLILCLMMLGLTIFLAVRPISYNMVYHGVKDDQYGRFESSRIFTRSKFLVNKNNNYDLPIVGFYYYKDGYLFDMSAKSNESYKAEVDMINSRWEEALQRDFYSMKINAFTIVAPRSDGEQTIYTCYPAIIITALSALLTIGFAVLTCTSFVAMGKAKKKAEEPAEEQTEAPAIE